MILHERMRGTEHAPRSPFRVLERVHGLAEIVECGAVVFVEAPRVCKFHYKREFSILTNNRVTNNALRQGYRVT